MRRHPQLARKLFEYFLIYGMYCGSLALSALYRATLVCSFLWC